MTLDDAILLTAGRDMWSTAALADIPSVRMADGPMGIASGRVDERDVSILTPAPVALAATWDSDLVGKVGALVGGEAKRQGVDLVLGPNLNLQRSPLGGRAFEMFGEDPLLAGILGAAWIAGLQSRHVGAVAKHLVCNDSETDRDSFNAVIDEAALRETYLLPFSFAARARCAGMMAAYNKVNGVHCAEHSTLLRSILRDEWKYRGFTVCDWFGSKSTVPAMQAGLDLEMPGPARFYGAKLQAAVDAGEITAPCVKDAAGRIADEARRWAGGEPGAEPGTREEILVEAAAASFVLLRNEDGLLPIEPGTIETLAVIGPNAVAPCLQGGTFAKVALRPDAVLPIEALAARYGASAIRCAPGCDPAPRLPSMPARPATDLGDGCTAGLTIDYFEGHDFSAAPLGSETRNTNSLTWFGSMPGLGAFDRPGGVRASGIVTPIKSGAHRLHIGGTGNVRLLVNGCEVLAFEQNIGPTDVMGVLKGGDSRSVEIELVAGQDVRIEAELRFQPARAQGLWYGLRLPGNANALLAEAEDLAREADAVLLLLGETADSGVESKDRSSTALPAEQRQLAQRVIAANRNVVVAINVAHAFDPQIADGARALMVVWYPGEAFGPALAQVIAGDREPSGRLPVTIAASEADYPAFETRPDPQGRILYSEGSNIGHRSFAARGIRPAYAFGEGLGYGDVDIESANVRCYSDRIQIVVRLTNRAGRPTASVVQIFDDKHALLGFTKINVPAAGSANGTIEIDPLAQRRWIDGEWKTLQMPTALIAQVGSAWTRVTV